MIRLGVPAINRQVIVLLLLILDNGARFAAAVVGGAQSEPIAARGQPVEATWPSQCNCIPVSTCARLISRPVEATRCGYWAPTNEWLICCPVTIAERYRRDELRRREAHSRANRRPYFHSDDGEKPWVWDAQPDRNDEWPDERDNNDLFDRYNHWDEFTYESDRYPYGHDDYGSPHHHQHFHYAVPDNAIDVYHSQSHPTSPAHAWLFKFQDPRTHRNCPPSISSEFDDPVDLATEAAPMSSVTLPAIATEQPATAAPMTALTQRQQAEALINGPTCGVSISTRIVGGENAGPGQFPWMARLAYRNKTSGRLSFRCAGSLISDRYVVTAAHCVTNLIEQIELVMVRLGESRPSDSPCADGQECTDQDYIIENVVHHSEYDRPKYANDIALLRIRPMAGGSGPFVALCLPIGAYASGAAISINHNGIIAGWGATSAASESSSPTLKWLRLPFSNSTTCASAYTRFSANSLTPIVVSPAQQLCVQGSPNLDACQGDSGGPLMSDPLASDPSSDQRYTLLGLVSFGPRTCGVSNFPGVYTRIDAYVDWILDRLVA